MSFNKIYLNKGLYDNKTIFENTLEAIKKSLNLNLGLYLTVRETKDKVLIIYEDNNLSRLHNVKDKIEDMTYDEILYLSYYHIPTLEEILKIINGKVDIILNIKTKLKNKEVINILSSYNGKFIIVGKPILLNKISKEKNNFLLGEIITKRNYNLFDFLIKPDYKSIDIKYFDILKIKKLKENRTPLIAYLINNQELLNEYYEIFDYLVIDNYSNLQLENIQN